MSLDVTPGTGATMNTDDVGGVKTPVSKLGHSAAGVAPTHVSTASPFPIVTATKITAAGNTITRPADTTTYAALDFIANSTTAGSCVIATSGFTVAAARANDQPGRMPKIKLERTGVTLGTATFRVHAYNVNPLAAAPAGGDNAALNPAAKAGYLGSFDVTINRLHGDGTVGIGVPTEGAYVDFVPATGTQNLFFLLEARAAFVPISGEVFTLTTYTE